MPTDDSQQQNRGHYGSDYVRVVQGVCRVCARSNLMGTILEIKTGRKWLILFGERGGTRTLDPMIKSHVLYRLSYALTRRAV
jgi:hypothetical protein